VRLSKKYINKNPSLAMKEIAKLSDTKEGKNEPY